MVLPLAVVSLAMVMPASSVCAQCVIDQTVRRAETMTTQIAETARELCGSQAKHAIVHPAIQPVPVVAQPTEPTIITIQPIHRPASAYLPTLIDLPPPHLG